MTSTSTLDFRPDPAPDRTPEPKTDQTSGRTRRALVLAGLLMALAVVVAAFIWASPPAAQHGPAHGLPGGSLGLGYHHRG